MPQQFPFHQGVPHKAPPASPAPKTPISQKTWIKISTQNYPAMIKIKLLEIPKVAEEGNSLTAHKKKNLSDLWDFSQVKMIFSTPNSFETTHF